MKNKHWNCKFYRFLILVIFALRLCPAFAQSESLSKIGSFRVTLDETQDQKSPPKILRLLPLPTDPDQAITFASPEQVKFVYQHEEGYIKPDEMMKKLQQAPKKDYLLIRLEKRFLGRFDAETHNNLSQKKVIDFAKKTGYRRCLILIDNAQTSNLVLTDILDGLEAPKVKAHVHAPPDEPIAIEKQVGKRITVSGIWSNRGKSGPCVTLDNPPNTIYIEAEPILDPEKSEASLRGINALYKEFKEGEKVQVTGTLRQAGRTLAKEVVSTAQSFPPHYCFYVDDVQIQHSH